MTGVQTCALPISVILVRKETTPDDIHGMDVAKGILTAVGGKSSHAAVVARGMGRPCVVGAGAISINEHGKQFHVAVKGKEVVVKEGDWVSIDGTTANVYLGKAQTNEPDPNSSYFGKLMRWADAPVCMPPAMRAKRPRTKIIATS